MAAKIKPSVTDGPAFCAAAAAVLTNKPAPMIAPMPRATSEPAVRVRFKPFSESLASSIKWLKGFFTNKLILSVGFGK